MALKAFGAIRAVVLSAGLAALVAVLASWTMTVAGGARPAWAASLQTFAIGIALAFLAAGIAASALMPSAAAITRSSPQGGAAAASPVLPLLLGVLAAVAFFQAPAVAEWWVEDGMLLTQATGAGPDPSGLRLIPAVILFALPALAALALVSFVLASILGMLVRAEIIFRVVAACVALQGGLVAGEQLVRRAGRALGTTIQQLIAADPDPSALAQVSEWLARHDAAGIDVSWRLVWILGGYLAVLAAAALVSSRQGGQASLDAESIPQVAPLPAPAIVQRTATQPQRGAGPSAADAFEYSTYSAEPRRTLLESVLRRYSTYDIQSIPPMSRARFSFSWTTGILRREPDGPDLLALTRAERHSVFARSHLVTDKVAGVPLGTLRPNGAGWEILDAAGAPFARVVEEKSGIGFICYIATVGERPVCRFTWAMQGLTVASAALDVEFLPGSDGCFDRALAVVLAPIVEQKARLASERRQ